MIPTYVTLSNLSYPGMIDDCLELLDRFYPFPVTVSCALDGETKGAQLLRLMAECQDRFLILLEDDFHLIRPVDRTLLEQVVEFCYAHDAMRFSLQSRRKYQFQDWPETELEVCGRRVYRADSRCECPFSLEASVWSRDYLLRHARPDMQSDTHIEREVSQRIQQKGHAIYALDHSVLAYRDAVGRGSRRFHLERNPLRLVARDEMAANALYLGKPGTVLLIEEPKHA